MLAYAGIKERTGIIRTDIPMRETDGPDVNAAVNILEEGKRIYKMCMIAQKRSVTG